ncbi:uncharacterized protein [Nicotiana tomentosiformis]|uniref:uncharacterized protein n=1 Tax=Nicotiana tomentosiformis TaxID=4098 RepID=UPI00051C0BFB|nr:uncharacterized protein LOC117279888 [Nicotiana tomentosiformis]XP_033515397.1 uncharacterized protein LOC117279888 [Nicotiana tomentosiformis]XP_033515398.1 uncharacterized protein LOC117279888 [Nicotiana tomentosiformis]XP_033515399.1 uncharacterized protein LOC117279888 [Nicotiana tomentosiformis]
MKQPTSLRLLSSVSLTKMKQPLCIKEKQGSLKSMPDPPFSLFYSSGGSTSVRPLIFLIKHPFTWAISEDVDPDLLEEFDKWLYLGTDTVLKSDCGVYVASFAEYVSIGELAVSKEDLSDIDQHHRRYGALHWDYARKKQDTNAISESEVTGRLGRRKGAPVVNERTQVRKKKN